MCLVISPIRFNSHFLLTELELLLLIWHQYEYEWEINSEMIYSGQFYFNIIITLSLGAEFVRDSVLEHEKYNLLLVFFYVIKQNFYIIRFP